MYVRVGYYVWRVCANGVVLMEGVGIRGEGGSMVPRSSAVVGIMGILVACLVAAVCLSGTPGAYRYDRNFSLLM